MTLHSSLASVSATRKRMAELGLDTKKSLGQHFLIDDGIVGKIIRLAAVDADHSVVEVGPGIGTLTEALLATGAQVTAVELDSALWEGLQQRFPALSLVCSDALSTKTIAQLESLQPTDLVANLPYAVAATIILEYFQRLPGLQSATVMVQKEVADRITAKPGTKDYGSYTIKLRLLATASGSFKVSRQSFYPPPRVDSTVVRLERWGVRGTYNLTQTGDPSAHYSGSEGSRSSESSVPPEPSSASELGFIAIASMLADAAFFQRRKTISNSMKAYFSAHGQEEGLVAQLLEAAGIDPTVRGESLSPEAYLALATCYNQR